MFSRLVSRSSSIAGPLPRRIVNFESKVPLMSVSTNPTGGISWVFTSSGGITS